MLRRSFSRAAVALNGTTINPNVKAAKVRELLLPNAGQNRLLSLKTPPRTHNARFRCS